jgi:hypothetical protein
MRPVLLVVALLLAGGGSALAATASPADPRVHIVSPVEGQQFAPGDEVTIVGEIAPPLQATDAGVGLRGLGGLTVTGFTGTGFEARFVIPEFYAGPLTLQPEAYAGRTVLGPTVTIKVKPRTPPVTLSVVNRNNYPSLMAGHPERLSVKGLYANGIERDLSSSEAGTTYTSSNPAVVTVDRDGVCRIAGSGLAVVTVENGGVREYATFAVDDPAHPGAPIDLTDHVVIRQGSVRADASQQIVYDVVQDVIITNVTALPLVGPLFLGIADLPKGVLPLGDTRQLELPGAGLDLLPGHSVSVELRFLNQGDASIQYKAKVYHGRAP